jgi:hypothetical protein
MHGIRYAWELALQAVSPLVLTIYENDRSSECFLPEYSSARLCHLDCDLSEVFMVNMY